MTKGINLTDLDPATQRRVIGSLHEQGIIGSGGYPSTKSSIARPRHRPRPKSRSWYIWCLKVSGLVFGYILFGLGWCLEYAGYYIKCGGERLRRIAWSS